MMKVKLGAILWFDDDDDDDDGSIDGDLVGMKLG